MNGALKKEWINRLRSGEYEQAQGYLMDRFDNREGFCCLGVLALAAGKTKEELLCEEHLDKVGLESLLGPWENASDVQFLEYDESTHTTLQRKLAAMNDTGKSFSEIADWIEKNIPED